MCQLQLKLRLKNRPRPSAGDTDRLHTPGQAPSTVNFTPHNLRQQIPYLSADPGPELGSESPVPLSHGDRTQKSPEDLDLAEPRSLWPSSESVHHPDRPERETGPEARPAAFGSHATWWNIVSNRFVMKTDQTGGGFVSCVTF